MNNEVLPPHVTHNQSGYRLEVYIPRTQKRLYIKQTKTLPELMEIYHECVNAGWEINELRKIREKYLRKARQPKHIIQKHGKYIVQINKKSLPYKYWGSYKTLEEAILVRDAILRGDFTHVQTRRKEHTPRKRSSYDKYISYDRKSGKYRVQRYDPDDQKVYSYGYFNTIDDARCERDWWAENNWDYDLLDLY